MLCKKVGPRNRDENIVSSAKNVTSLSSSKHPTWKQQQQQPAATCKTPTNNNNSSSSPATSSQNNLSSDALEKLKQDILTSDMSVTDLRVPGVKLIKFKKETLRRL